MALGVGACVLGAALVGALGAPAGAANAKGCTGEASSLDRNDRGIDLANAPGEGGTKANPLQLDPYGTVHWRYSFDSLIRNGTWKITTSGAAGLSFSGKIGADQKQSDSGTENLKKHLVRRLPILGETVLFTGLVKGDVVVAGAGGTRCTFSGWVQITGSPVRTPLFSLAMVLLLIAIVLLFLGWPVEDVALLTDNVIPRTGLEHVHDEMPGGRA